MGMVFGVITGSKVGDRLCWYDAVNGAQKDSPAIREGLQYTTKVLNPGAYNVRMLDGRTVTPARVNVGYAPQRQDFTLP